MILRIFPELDVIQNTDIGVTVDVGFREDVRGFPRKQAVCLYVMQLRQSKPPLGICRIDLSPNDAIRLSNLIANNSKAAAAGFDRAALEQKKVDGFLHG